MKAETLPDSLGGHKILKELGRGAVGVVYLARQESLQRLLAIKVLFFTQTRDADFIERFRREGQIAARLRHPNIVQVFDFCDTDDKFYIAMEYIGPRNLKDVIVEAGGKLSQAQALKYTDNLLSGLHHAHVLGIVHRDVKPANVLISDSDQAVLTDFSIAQMASSSRITQTGTMMGTPEYMCPELFDAKYVDGRADAYACGLMLYEMLTGTNPFARESVPQVLKAQLFDIPSPPHVLDPNISVALSDIIMKSLSKSANDRFKDAEEMRQALSRLEVAPEPPAPAPRPAAPVVVPVRPVAEARPAAERVEANRGVISVFADDEEEETAVDKTPVRRMPIKLTMQTEETGVEPPRRKSISLPPPVVPEPEPAVPEPVPTAPKKGGWGTAFGVLAISGLACGAFIYGSSLSPHSVLTASPSALAAAPAPVATPTLTPTPPPTEQRVQVRVTPEVKQLTIQMDKVSELKIGESVKASPGAHIFTVKAPFYRPQEKTVQVEAGKDQALDFKLEPAKLTLTVNSKPANAQIFLDGKNTGQRTGAKLQLIASPEKKYKIKLRKTGYKDSEQTFTVKDENPKSLDIAMSAIPVAAPVAARPVEYRQPVRTSYQPRQQRAYQAPPRHSSSSGNEGFLHRQSSQARQARELDNYLNGR